MRASQILIATLKETPADAEVISHQLMLRAGLIRRLASGLYTWLPMGLKVLRKVESIVREEMARAGAQELLMPTIQMILRYTAVGNWRDYLTGKAHPSVGIKVDNLKMIKMAHKLQVNEIPPVVRLKVVEEDEPLNGEDYFSPGKSINSME